MHIVENSNLTKNDLYDSNLKGPTKNSLKKVHILGPKARSQRIKKKTFDISPIYKCTKFQTDAIIFKVYSISQI